MVAILEERPAPTVPQAIPECQNSNSYKVLQLLRKCIRATDIHSKSLQARYGLTTPQQLCLLLLREEALSVSALAKAVHLSASTVVGIVDRLEEQGMVYRERQSTDRRVVKVQITEKGQVLADNSPPPIQEKLMNGLSNLSEDKQNAIVRSLEEITDLMGLIDMDASPILEPEHQIKNPSGDELYGDYSENAVEESHKKNSKTQFSIRPAEREDMDMIADFIRSTADWYRPFCDEADMIEHDVDENWKEENFHRREFFLGLADEKAIGTISLQHFGDYGYLGYIYLSEKEVGKNYGQILMNFIEQIARDRGLKGLVLIAHPEANWAVRAYEKFGFKRILTEKSEIITWQDGALESYFEEGFHLFSYDF